MVAASSSSTERRRSRHCRGGGGGSTSHQASARGVRAINAPMSAGFGTKGSVAAVGEAERPLAIAANRLHTVIGGSYNCYGGSTSAARARAARRAGDESLMMQTRPGTGGQQERARARCNIFSDHPVITMFGNTPPRAGAPGELTTGARRMQRQIQI